MFIQTASRSPLAQSNAVSLGAHQGRKDSPRWLFRSQVTSYGSNLKPKASCRPVMVHLINFWVVKHTHHISSPNLSQSIWHISIYHIYQITPGWVPFPGPNKSQPCDTILTLRLTAWPFLPPRFKRVGTPRVPTAWILGALAMPEEELLAQDGLLRCVGKLGITEWHEVGLTSVLQEMDPQ